jgi:hypothetical protein
MRKLPVRIGGVVAAASAALVLAGGAAFASPVGAAGPAGPAAKMTTGPEVVSGAAYGKAAIANVTPIPLTFAGVVATTDHGFKLGPGGGNTHTLMTPVGDLTVTGIGKQVQTQTTNMKTCHFTFTERQQFKFVPGKSTGEFAGASGPGAYQVFFGAYEPRFTSGKHKGECNGNAQPLAKGAVGTFLAAGVLTVG